MKKKWFISIVIIIGLITASLVVIGVVFDKEEFEKQQGRTSYYDIGADGTTAYVFYEEGHPGIYLWNDTAHPREPLVQLSIEQEILDISFSPDGKKLAYVISHKNKRTELQSAIHVVDVETKDDQELLAAESLITEIEYHPTDADSLYYLKAGTFQNYSPIASARPHDFDLYRYQVSTGENTQYTDLQKYMMRSLNLSPTENAAYVVMDDDAHAETAEDIFATHQRIFKISLDEPYEYQVVSQKDYEQDIYDFTVTPNDDGFIFQSVSQTGADGIFDYELFFYDRKTEEEKQLTQLKKHTSHPIIGPDGKTIFFMVDQQFGHGDPDYYLYKMNIDGSQLEEAVLYMQ